MRTRQQNHKNNLLNNAASSFSNGDKEQAIEVLQELIIQNPNDPIMLSKISILLVENDMDIEAIEIFGEGLANNPNNNNFKRQAQEVGKVIEGKWSKRISEEKQDEIMLEF